jgi:hypothetical protein
MSEQLSALEDAIHTAAHTASQSGLDLGTIAEALEGRAHFARLLQRHSAQGYPAACSDLTARRRARAA